MSQRKLLTSLALLMLLGIGSVITRRKTVSAPAETVFQLDFTSGKGPADGTQFFHSAFKTQLAPVSMDQDGNLYVVTLKHDKSSEGKFIQQVIKADNRGKIAGVFPLTRKDGRIIRTGSDYFSVSPSGTYWWIVRKAVEDSTNYKDPISHTWIITAYDRSGRPVQEWKHPFDVGEGLLQAVDENEAYLVDEAAASNGQVWIYKVGEKTGIKQPTHGTFSGQHMTSEGRFWSLAHRLPPIQPLQYTASVTELGKAPQVAYKFKSPKSVAIFWHDPVAGLFLFSYSQEKTGTVFNLPKTAYRVDTKGRVHKLFTTSDIFKVKANESLLTGRLLKADKQFVWIETGYLKDGKMTEYQIVKVAYK